jgi:glycogen synthase
MLARGLKTHGYAVKIATLTKGTDSSSNAIEVHRNPSGRELVDLFRWCDVCVQNYVSLRLAWPLLFAQRPCLIVNHGWYTAHRWTQIPASVIKHLVLSLTDHVSVSKAVAARLPGKSKVIPNCYDDEVFYRRSEVQKNADLIFVGRLVSDKGLDVLMHALYRLAKLGLRPSLTVVGTGPAETDVKRIVQELQLSAQVQFLGTRRGEELAAIFNKHKILVVPSRWDEPFGIVALEGLACGCVVVGSSGGGLPEAIGDCGVTFPNGNDKRLAEVLSDLLRDESFLTTYLQNREAHLAQHSQRHIVGQFAASLERLVNTPE